MMSRFNPNLYGFGLIQTFASHVLHLSAVFATSAVLYLGGIAFRNDVSAGPTLYECDDWCTERICG